MQQPSTQPAQRLRGGHSSQTRTPVDPSLQLLHRLSSRVEELDSVSPRVEEVDSVSRRHRVEKSVASTLTHTKIVDLPSGVPAPEAADAGGPVDYVSSTTLATRGQASSSTYYAGSGCPRTSSPWMQHVFDHEIRAASRATAHARADQHTERPAGSGFEALDQTLSRLSADAKRTTDTNAARVRAAQREHERNDSERQRSKQLSEQRRLAAEQEVADERVRALRIEAGLSEQQAQEILAQNRRKRLLCEVQAIAANDGMLQEAMHAMESAIQQKLNAKLLESEDRIAALISALAEQRVDAEQLAAARQRPPSLVRFLPVSQ